MLIEHGCLLQVLLHSYNSVTAFSREIEDQRPPKSELATSAALMRPPLLHALVCAECRCASAGMKEVEALTEVTRLLEAADDDGGAEGAGDLLDDFVVTAATGVSLRCQMAWIAKAWPACPALEKKQQGL